jgi:type VI secretion system protein ImpM
MNPGFHGKVPARGDFISRRLPPGFAAPWDTWLQAFVTASRANLGEAFMPAWLEAPVWHFALGPGTAGPAAIFGVMIPSADRVGRAYPFTLFSAVAPIPKGLTLSDWSARAEALALGALDDNFAPDTLDRALTELGPPAAHLPPNAATDDWPKAALSAMIEIQRGASHFWWRRAPRVAAGMLASSGLPDPARAVALVSGMDGQA